jgi:hypothetical protein
MAYRTAGITYDRGVIFDRGLGPVDVAVGFVNGNGINVNYDINSPGYARPDKMFDNDSGKSVFGRVGVPIGPVDAGLFALTGQQKSATGPAGTVTGTRDTDKLIYGVDVAGTVRGNIHWYVQALWNRWSDFLDADPTRDYSWLGGFAGVDYIPNDRWAFSLLYNYAEADDFAGTGTIYEGIKMNTLTFTSSYYFMRNVKGIIEVNADFLSKDPSPPYVGHQTQENYILIGFDAAF